MCKLSIGPIGQPHFEGQQNAGVIPLCGYICFNPFFMIEKKKKISTNQTSFP